MKRLVLCTLFAFGLTSPLSAEWYFSMRYNDSRVEVFEVDGPGHMQIYITYTKPGAELLTLGIQPGSIMFTGTIYNIGSDEAVAGAAYAYKPGCPPIPYPVEGGWHQTENGRYLFLSGQEPIFINEECHVVEYGWGPNSTITITP